jgi:hypothetical protein
MRTVFSTLSVLFIGSIVVSSAAMAQQASFDVTGLILVSNPESCRLVDQAPSGCKFELRSTSKPSPASAPFGEGFRVGYSTNINAEASPLGPSKIFRQQKLSAVSYRVHLDVEGSLVIEGFGE